MVALAIVLPVLAILPWKRGSLARAIHQLRGALALGARARRARLDPPDRPLGARPRRRRARALARPRRPHRDRQPHPPRPRRASRVAPPRLEPAARRLGQGARPCRPRRHDLRRRRHHRLGHRGHPRRAPRRKLPVGGYSSASTPSTGSRGPNYDADTGDRHASCATAAPSPPCTPRSASTKSRRMATTEAAIDRGLTRDLYVALGDPQPDGGWALRTYIKPFSNWIWLGAMIMAAGGTVSLTDRRYRVGAPARRAAPAAGGPRRMTRSCWPSPSRSPRPARASPSSPTRSCPTQARRPAPAPSPRSSAASSASPSRSTTRTPTSPATCASWSASASPPATATPRSSTSSSPATASSCCSARPSRRPTPPSGSPAPSCSLLGGGIAFAFIRRRARAPRRPTARRSPPRSRPASRISPAADAPSRVPAGRAGGYPARRRRSAAMAYETILLSVDGRRRHHHPEPPRGDERPERRHAPRDHRGRRPGPRDRPRPRPDRRRPRLLLRPGPRRARAEADIERTLRDEYEPMLTAIYDCPIPTIAAVNGVAAGAGANLALACDVAIAAEVGRLRPGLRPHRPDPRRRRHLLAAPPGRLRPRHGRRPLRRAGHRRARPPPGA